MDISANGKWQKPEGTINSFFSHFDSTNPQQLHLLSSTAPALSLSFVPMVGRALKIFPSEGKFKDKSYYYHKTCFLGNKISNALLPVGLLAQLPVNEHKTNDKWCSSRAWTSTHDLCVGAQMPNTGSHCIFSSARECSLLSSCPFSVSFVSWDNLYFSYTWPKLANWSKGH